MRNNVGVGFRCCRSGSISVIVALALPILVGFVALAAEFGHGLALQAENQRVADLAAYAGAVAYGTSSSTSTMTAAARNVAVLNGISASGVTASLVTSPRTSGSQAVKVTVSTSSLLLLAPVLQSGSTLTINATASAEIGAAPPPCILALSGIGTGISLSGATSVSAPACAVASNASLTVPCGATLGAKAIAFDGGVPSQPCSGITGSITKTATVDPLATNAGIVAAQNHAASLSTLSAPPAPTLATNIVNGIVTSVVTTDIDFGYNILATQAQVALIGCVASVFPLFSANYTVTCPAGTNINAGNVTVEAGVTVAFNPNGVLQGLVSGPSGTTLNIAGTLANKGTLTVGPTIVKVAKGIVATGGARTSFAAGMFAVGAGASICNGAGTYSICNLGTSMTFAGPSSFSVTAGVYDAGGSSLSLGSGTGNVLAIGSASDGDALTIGGGATLSLAETDANTFRLVGNVTESGGACTTFGIADQHDITGNFSVAGGTVLGAGVYSVGGYIAVGANGGGDVTCGGSSYGLTGLGVTLVTEGHNTISGGSCNGASFCVAAGFGNVTLTAPSSGTYKNLVLLSPSTTSTGSAIFAEGSSNTTLAGALYVPNGPLTLSGAATIAPSSTQCLQIVATQVTLSGSGKATATSCFSGTSGVASAMLVQ